MAVLIEAYSVIIRVQAIRDKYFGGVKAFMDDIPNSTFCTDGSVGRVGFMSLDDAFFYTATLMSKGLHNSKEDEENTDIAYAMQDVGTVGNCSWLLVERFEIGESNCEVTACSLAGDIQQGLSVPKNWSYEQYASFTLASNEDIDTIVQEGDSSVLEVSLIGENGRRYVGLANIKTDKNEPLH